MAAHLIAVGASAGGVESLRDLVAALPADLSAAVLVVLHLSPRARSVLPDILDRAGQLSCSSASDGETAAPGHVYVAPPDRHLLIEGGRLALTDAEPEHGMRPAIDPLFRSAARWARAATIGVILSGTGTDGATGAADIQRAGGRIIVEDPADAQFAGMPMAALREVPEAFRTHLTDIGPLLERWCAGPAVRTD